MKNVSSGQVFTERTDEQTNERTFAFIGLLSEPKINVSHSPSPTSQILSFRSFITQNFSHQWTLIRDQVPYILLSLLCWTQVLYRWNICLTLFPNDCGYHKCNWHLDILYGLLGPLCYPPIECLLESKWLTLCVTFLHCLLLTYLLNSLVVWTRDLRCPISIPRAELTAALIPLLLPDTAALEEVTLPDNNNGINNVFCYWK